ncbi:MAG: VanW family protein, partial [Lachnospiraceae bacterium]|nr:VanW family protein [Lachnospiraceae bacterium]
MKKLFAGVLALILILIPAEAALADGTIPDGVTIGGKDLSGSDEKGARQILSDYLDEIKQSEISLTIGDEVKATFMLEEAGIELNEDDLIAKAMDVGYSGNVLERYMELREAADKGLELKPEFTYDKAKLEEVVTKRIEALNCEPEKAAIEIVDDKPVVKLSRDGIKVDTKATLKALEEKLSDPENAAGISVPITAEITKAEDSDIDYASIQDCLGSYTTVMGYYMENRVKNIINAAGKINGVVVKPGETFAINGYLEPYTYDNGYVEATGYSNGRVVPAMGGGVCQLATTTYNAALNAEMEIVERHPHIMTVSYVPLSFDASIYEGSDNFKFTNNTDYPIYIYTHCSDDLKLTVAIFGKETRPANRTIEFASSTEATINPPADVVTVDPSKPAGYREVTQGAHIGYQC